MPTMYVSSHTCWNQVSSLLGLVLFYCRTPIAFRLCYFSFPSHTSKYISLQSPNSNLPAIITTYLSLYFYPNISSSHRPHYCRLLSLCDSLLPCRSVQSLIN